MDPFPPSSFPSAAPPLSWFFCYHPTLPFFPVFNCTRNSPPFKGVFVKRHTLNRVFFDSFTFRPPPSIRRNGAFFAPFYTPCFFLLPPLSIRRIQAQLAIRLSVRRALTSSALLVSISSFLPFFLILPPPAFLFSFVSAVTPQDLPQSLPPHPVTGMAITGPVFSPPKRDLSLSFFSEDKRLILSPQWPSRKRGH